jgi:WD40 repeat protein
MSAWADRGAPENLAISPDGAWLACGGERGTVRLWQLATGRPGKGWLVPEKGRVSNVAFSPDGQTLAAAARRAIYLLDQETGTVWGVLRGHPAPGNPSSAPVYAVSFSADGRWVLSAGRDGTARIWDGRTGECRTTFRGHTGEVFAAAFHPDGARVASADRDQVVRLWDPATGDELLHLRGHTSYVFALAWSLDGTTLAFASGDYTVRLWETVPLERRLHARRELEALWPAAERLVNRLLREEGKTAKVAERLGKGEGVGEVLRRAAGYALLRRAAKAEP